MKKFKNQSIIMLTGLALLSFSGATMMQSSSVHADKIDDELQKNMKDNQAHDNAENDAWIKRSNDDIVNRAKYDMKHHIDLNADDNLTSVDGGQNMYTGKPTETKSGKHIADYTGKQLADYSVEHGFNDAKSTNNVKHQSKPTVKHVTKAKTNHVTKKHIATKYYMHLKTKRIQAKRNFLEYKDVKFKVRAGHKFIKKNQKLSVKKIVKVGKATRFQLRNGHYVTANKNTFKFIK